MDKVEIFKWLNSQMYQTEREETGEYLMYYGVDMPKILEDYYEYKVKKLNEPAVSKRAWMVGYVKDGKHENFLVEDAPNELAAKVVAGYNIEGKYEIVSCIEQHVC